VKGKFLIITTQRMVQSVDRNIRSPILFLNHNRIYRNGCCIDKEVIICVNFDFG